MNFLAIINTKEKFILTEILIIIEVTLGLMIVFLLINVNLMLIILIYWYVKINFCNKKMIFA